MAGALLPGGERGEHVQQRALLPRLPHVHRPEQEARRGAALGARAEPQCEARLGAAVAHEGHQVKQRLDVVPAHGQRHPRPPGAHRGEGGILLGALQLAQQREQRCGGAVQQVQHLLQHKLLCFGVQRLCARRALLAGEQVQVPVPEGEQVHQQVHERRRARWLAVRLGAAQRRAEVPAGDRRAAERHRLLVRDAQLRRGRGRLLQRVGEEQGPLQAHDATQPLVRPRALELLLCRLHEPAVLLQRACGAQRARGLLRKQLRARVGHRVERGEQRGEHQHAGRRHPLSGRRGDRAQEREHRARREPPREREQVEHLRELLRLLRGPGEPLQLHLVAELGRPRRARGALQRGVHAGALGAQLLDPREDPLGEALERGGARAGEGLEQAAHAAAGAEQGGVVAQRERVGAAGELLEARKQR